LRESAERREEKERLVEDVIDGVASLLFLRSIVIYRKIGEAVKKKDTQGKKGRVKKTQM